MKYLSISLQLFTFQHVVKVANPKLMNNVMADIQIPLPPLDIQQKIVDEIGVVERREEETMGKIEN